MACSRAVTASGAPNFTCSITFRPTAISRSLVTSQTDAAPMISPDRAAMVSAGESGRAIASEYDGTALAMIMINGGTRISFGPCCPALANFRA
jgi:hypothetical protein